MNVLYSCYETRLRPVIMSARLNSPEKLIEKLGLDTYFQDIYISNEGIQLESCVKDTNACLYMLRFI